MTDPAARRTSAGRVAVLVLGAVLLLCVAGGASAYALVSHLEGRGAKTPPAAVDGFLHGVFVARDEAAARRYVCPEVDPASIRSKIDQINQDERDHGPASYSWTTTEKSRRTSRVIFDVDLTASGGLSEHQRLEITVTANGGWRVCGVRRLG